MSCVTTRSIVSICEFSFTTSFLTLLTTQIVTHTLYRYQKLNSKLPEYAIPEHVVRLKTLPVRVGSGKLDRKKLPIPGQEHRVKLSRALKKSSSKRKRSDLDRKVLKIWQKVLNREDISYEDNFFDVGGESLLAAKLIGHLEVELASDTRIHQDRLTVTELYSNPTCSALIHRLLVVSEQEVEEKEEERSHSEDDYVAVVGLSGSFPGASDISSFWNNLVQGKDSLRRFTESELISKHVSSNALRNERYVRAGQCVSNPDHFDAYFWGTYYVLYFFSPLLFVGLTLSS